MTAQSLAAWIVLHLLFLTTTAAAADGPTVVRKASPSARAADAVNNDWQGPLGSGRNGRSGETRLLQQFGPEGPTLLWQMETGQGYAPPLIHQGRLVFSHQIGNETRIDCLNAESGATIWSQRIPTSYSDSYSRQHGPRSSPVATETHVYIHNIDGQLLCLDLPTGAITWRRDLAKELAVPESYFGVGSTPVVWRDRLIVNVGGAKATVAAFDLASGKTVWTADGGWGAGYAAVQVATIQGKERALVFAGGKSRPPSGGLLCLDPATGAIDFQHPWRSRMTASVNAATPTVVGNQIFLTASYDTGGCLLNITPELKPTVAWSNQSLGCQWSTPVYHDGYLYGFDGGSSQEAELVCLELESGRECWRAQPEWQEDTPNGKRTARIFRGALLYADGGFLCLGEGGHLLWLDLTPQGCKIRCQARPFAAEQSFTPPALANGLLYLCQNSNDEFDNSPPQLRCYDLRSR